MMGIRWCAGNEQVATWQGEETGWFLIPFTLASAIGRSLAQLHASKHEGINCDGFDQMARWLSEVGAFDDAMCY